MFCNLEAEITRIKLDKKEIASTIGKSYNTLTLKLSGKYPLTLDEALLIQEEYFPNLDFKYLFATDQNKAS